MSRAIPFATYVTTCMLLWLLGTFYFVANTGQVELHISIESEDADLAQTFYSRNGQWNETDSIKTVLVKGVNDITVPLPGLFIGDTVRFDPGQKPGVFRLMNAYWSAGAARVPIAYRTIVNGHPLASDISSTDTDSRVTARDDDPQLIVPTPSLRIRATDFALTALLSFVALVALLAAVRRRAALPTVAVAMIACCGVLYFYTCASMGPRLPLFDDWRYVLPGRFNIIDGWSWLGAVGNDTYFLTNQLFDFVVLKLTDDDFFMLRLTSVGLLLLQIALQMRIVFGVTRARPLVGAIAIAASLASLSAGAYWSNAAIAYQQALPTLFGTILLSFFMRPEDSRFGMWATVALIACCLASGLAYISGGALLASLGISAFVIYARRSPSLTRASLLVLGAGVSLFVVQFLLVTLQQGSLLEHSHHAETVYPWDHRFWIFFVALFGRALGYGGPYIALDALCAAVVLTPAVVIALRELRGSRVNSITPRFWTLLALYAGIGSATYAALVAFGRAGFAPITADAGVFTTMGKTRFHFWPIAAMLPYAWLGWMACVDRWPRHMARGVAACAALLLVVPKSVSLLDNATRQRETADIERQGARCVVAQLDEAKAGRPVVCPALTIGPNDIGPTLLKLRDGHSAIYGRLLDEGAGVGHAITP